MNALSRFVMYAVLGVVSVVVLMLMSTVGLFLAVALGIAFFFNMRSLRAKMREHAENGTFVIRTFRYPPNPNDDTVEPRRLSSFSEESGTSQSPEAEDPNIVDLDPSEYRTIDGKTDAGER